MRSCWGWNTTVVEEQRSFIFRDYGFLNSLRTYVGLRSEANLHIQNAMRILKNVILIGLQLLIKSNNFCCFAKSKTKPEVLKLAGNRLLFVNGLDWVRHRRILNPTFSMEKNEGFLFFPSIVPSHVD
ncbi:uncharacterized protein LOC111831964 isoform X2 [Capsella rubella]|uniref:uncharacterized protein LOC111831964 isoform X2 n=1 Tax=Capsella rubella TaxID=81985 RepID=UPI000CD51CC0|nr:uncharacterized protein LOC111831964 isoform X2 [Capsella rubella]